MTFGIAYLDVKERKLFRAYGNNSGAWPTGSSLTPTMQGFVDRRELSAYAGAHFWMYCGDRDLTHGVSMCTEMAKAQQFVTSYGGTVGELFRDPTGGHGALNTNGQAQASMFAYFESLR